MSAVPLSRGRSAPRLSPDPAWIELLDPVWDDPHLDPLAELLYIRLRRWASIHPGCWPTSAQLGTLIRRSRQVAAGYLAALVRSGYVRRRADGGYDLTRPAPRASGAPRPEEWRGMLFAESPCLPTDASCLPTDSGEPNPPPTPPLYCQGSKETSTTPRESSSSSAPPGGEEGEPSVQELVDDLVRRAVEAFASASPAEVLAAVREHGAESVEVAIDKCLAMDPRPFSFRYALGMLRNWRAEEAIVRRPVPPKPASAPRLNHNPGPKYAPVPPEERASLRDWRKFLPPGCPVPPAQKKPAAGSHANVPPPPDPEMNCAAPEASYDAPEEVSRCNGEHNTPQSAPGASNPAPPPAGGASPRSDHAPGPSAGGRFGRVARGGGDPYSRPSPGPRAGAQGPAPRGVVAVGPVVSALLRRSAVESDAPEERRQRRSDEAPAPHRRE